MSDLQVKIFTRWVNQKLASGKCATIPDTKTGFADGTALVNLIEVLSEAKFPGKPLKSGISRMAAMDQLSRAMDFVKAQGVTNKLPPSNEDLADGAERPIMGMIWSIMQRFLKFGDDDDAEKLSAEDSLLMWVQNQISSYEDINVKSFTKSFHNGKAYAALIHKNRPKFLDPAECTGSNDENLQKVLDAATRYFDFDQYITAAEIQKLDSKSAFIFLSEFYYGIAKMRKVDLSCRRITKLVNYTKINDAHRANYSEKSKAFVDRLAKVNTVLNDRTIDNTMAGAKGKVAEFAKYKQEDKPSIIADFLTCESVFNQLAMRLNDHHRPAFAPPAGQDVPALRECLKVLEQTEKERQISLVDELNRQIRLAALNVQHQDIFDKLSSWGKVKTEYLEKKEDIDSTGDAMYQINVLANYNDESTEMQGHTGKELVELGAELIKEKYENSAEVSKREGDVASMVTSLNAGSAAKKIVLDDTLASEIEKERLRVLFASQAAEFARYIASLVADLPKTHFGFNLKEVEAFKATLDANDTSTNATLATKTTVFTTTNQDAEAAGVTHNKYTEHTVAELGERGATLTAAQAARNAAYDAELERVRFDDSLCSKFAGIANPLSALFDANKEIVTNATGDLEAQILTTGEKIAEEAAHKDKIAEAQAVQAEMDGRGVQFNAHSHLNSADIQLLQEQYQSFLTKKDTQLKEELAYKAMRGLTQEQFDEIDAQFTQFDKDGSKALSKSEFKSCLFSLGEEKNGKEVVATMEKFGTAESIQYAGFKEFMISTLGDSDTQPEIMEGWELINKGAEVCKVLLMKETILRDEDVSYVEETAPKVGDDYDYKAWTEDVFSR